jgi:hypothetical protein
LRGESLIVKRRFGARCGLEGLALADKNQVDNFLAVDRVGKPDAEILVLEQLALDRIFVGQVEVFMVAGMVSKKR